MLSLFLHVYTGLDISTHLLTQTSVKGVRQMQMVAHSPEWRVRFASPRNYIPFCKEMPKHTGTCKFTISITCQAGISTFVFLM